jgi:alanine racemase
MTREPTTYADDHPRRSVIHIFGLSPRAIPITRRYRDAFVARLPYETQDAMPHLVCEKQIGTRRVFRPVRRSDRGGIRNSHLLLVVDLGVVRKNVEHIASSAGVDVLAVVKADAYGLGIEAVSDTIADVVAGFCVFQAEEAVSCDLARRTGKRVLALGPPESTDASDYIFHHVTPTVGNVEQARQLRRARPALCVDTGMQRFSCPPNHCRSALTAGLCGEAFTHATQLGQVQKFLQITEGLELSRHAAASSLLQNPDAVLDAVRPGLSMYRNAVTVSSRLVELHSSSGPAGYSGFVTARHGVILAGYAHGLRKGLCLLNGRKSRVLEVGMQSAFVEADAHDRIGDEVVLLGGELTEHDVAQCWDCGPHEVLTSLSSAATRTYVS